MNVAADNYSYI